MRSPSAGSSILVQLLLLLAGPTCHGQEIEIPTTLSGSGGGNLFFYSVLVLALTLALGCISRCCLACCYVSRTTAHSSIEQRGSTTIDDLEI